MKLFRSAAVVALTAALFATVSAPEAQAIPPHDILIKLRSSGNFCTKYGDVVVNQLTATQSQWAIHDCVNEARQGAGLPPLKLSVTLSNVASAHAQRSVQLRWWVPGRQYAEDGSAHKDPQTKTLPADRIRNSGFCAPSSLRSGRENAAAGHGVWTDPATGKQQSVTARWVVRTWLSDYLHRATLLDPTAVYEGVAWAPGYAYQTSQTVYSPAATFVMDTASCV